MGAHPEPEGTTRRWRNRIVGHGEEAAEQLLANPKNWRIHPKNQQDALEGVLKEVGWVQEVIVNQRTGFVVDGHLRAAMAISAGEKVPVVYVDLSEEEEALILATLDPLSAMAARDKAAFDELVGGLDDAYKALVAPTVPDGALLGLKQGLTDEDAAPALPEVAVTQPEDLWLCGPHRVLCSDATQQSATSRLFAQTIPFLMVTDPPYGVRLEPEWREEAGLNPRTVQGGKVANDDRVDWSPAWRLFPGSVVYVWHAGIYAGEVAASLFESDFQIRAQIIWRKQHFVISRGAYHWQHEPCWYAVRKGKSAHWRGDRTQSTVCEVQNLSPLGGNHDEKKTGHGTQKPVEIMRRPILNHTERGAGVFDPFLGSGTTLIAAEMTERSCYGIDIDARYVDVIVKRWQEFTGKQATLDGDGRTFSEISSERLGVRNGINEESLRAEVK